MLYSRKALLAVWLFLALVVSGGRRKDRRERRRRRRRRRRERIRNFFRGGSSSSSSSDEEVAPPNILFMFIDDLGWNDVGYNGASDAFTPFIDSLATEDSLILLQSYTQHYCTQSRTALLTGRYPMRFGLQHQVITPVSTYGLPDQVRHGSEILDVKLLPEILREGGYETHLVGKWHLGFARPKYLPNQRGFDSFYGFFNGEGDYYEHFNLFQDTIFGYDLRNNSEPARADGIYSSYLFGNVTRDLLRRYGSEQDSAPFFIELAFQLVHSPNEVPDRFKEPYAGIADIIQEIPTFPPQAGAIPGIGTILKTFDANRLNRIAMSTAVDSVIEQLVYTLKSETNLWQNTLVVFQSDNGGPTQSSANNYPLRAGKFSLFEGGVRTPTFVTGGALKASRKGQSSELMMHITDWYPTLLELAGIDASDDDYVASLDGVSQLSAIQNDAPSARESILHSVNPLLCTTADMVCGALRKGDWKLAVGREVTAPLNLLAGWTRLFHVTGANDNPTIDCGGPAPPFIPNPAVAPFNGQPLLFNIKNDPCEYSDLSLEYPEIVADMMAELVAFNESMALPLQLSKPLDPEAANPAGLDGWWGPFLTDDSDQPLTITEDVSVFTNVLFLGGGFSIVAATMVLACNRRRNVYKA